MKAVKKYLAVMMSIFMIASLCPATIYASPEEGDMAEEIPMAEEAAPVPELDEEAGPGSVETVNEASEEEVEAIVPEEPSYLDADESSEEMPGLTTGESSKEAADEIEEEVPEEIIGAGVQVVQVGDGVTATFDPNTGKVVFYSSGGTLWNDWRSKSGFETSQIKSISSTGKLYLPADSSALFYGCSSLTNLDTSYFDTSKVNYMYYMFYNCSSLTNLDLSSFNTSNVTYMYDMFNGCSSLTNLDLSSFNTSNVTHMSYMFNGCSSLTNLDLSSFNTSNVKNMYGMFYNCSSLTNLDLSSFNTSNVTDMCSMFYDCNNLTNLDLSSFDTSKVSEMPCMFYNCSNLTNLDLSSFDTSKVREMPGMFYNCSNLTNLDLSSFNTSNVLDMSDMFYVCTNLEVLRTPKKHTSSGIKLPLTMYDNSGVAYTELPVLESSIILGKTQKIAHEYAAKPISECTVTLKPTSYTYDGKSMKPAVTVKNGNKAFDPGTDYTVSYSNNTKVGTATVTITATETGGLKGSISINFTIKQPAASGFSDVQDSDHAYYKAIYWAADAGITKGYPDGTFGINRSCTRGEMMMFLWRYAGKKEPTAVSKSPFKDVPKTHTFYKAILWGSQKGITKGYSDGTFGIDRNVSRGECMMFLWRLKGKPAPKAVAKSPFPDVPKSHVFYNAVLWGYQKKITTGFTSGKLKGKFGVNENCSRGQIVTFLYRAK